MKKYIVLSLCIICLASSVHAKKKKEIHSFYQHSPLKLDAEIDDWGDMAIFDESTSLISNISNDHEYIYIKIRISSYAAVSRLLMSGFTIWFNNEGKNRPEKGLAFPIQADISDNYKQHIKHLKGLSNTQADRMKKSYTEEFNNKYASGLSAVRIVNKNFEDIYYRPSSIHEDGLSAIIKLVDYDLFIYEARIPIDLVLDNKEDYFNSDQKTFCIGYEYGKIEIETKGDPTTSMSIHERTSSYGRRNRHQVQDYQTIPPLTVWYKRVFLSKE